MLTKFRTGTNNFKNSIYQKMGRGNAHNSLFILILIALFFFYNFQHFVMQAPFGLHFWRQTDSLSFVSHYVMNGYNFFKPGTLSLFSAEGNCAGEFPLFYYLAAVLTPVISPEVLIRVISCVTVFAGLFFLYRMALKVFRDTVYAMTSVLIIFSSGTLLFFTCNYLPDTIAFGFTLIGLYHSYEYLKNQKKRNLGYLMFFFMSAGLVKITFLIFPLSYFITLLVSVRTDKSLTGKGRYLSKQEIISIITIVLIPAGWYVFAGIYNKINHSEIFLTTARPLWAMSQGEIHKTIHLIFNYWYNAYYYPKTRYMIYAMLIVGIAGYRLWGTFYARMAAFSVAGSVLYVLLFFRQFENHNYYFITIIPALYLVFMNSILVLNHYAPRVMRSVGTKIFFILLTVISMNYGRKVVMLYTKEDGISNIGVQLRGIDGKLDSAGIGKNDKIIVWSDQTPNGSLYSLQRKGWTFTETSEILLPGNKKHLQEANHILITDTRAAGFNEIQPLLEHEEFRYNESVIYKIRK